MLTNILDKIYGAVSSLSPNTLLTIAWCSFGAIFLVAAALTLFNAAFRRTGKRPFMWLVNAFTAVTLAALLMQKNVAYSALIAALFWCAGYILYGILELLSRRNPKAEKVRKNRPAAPKPIVAPAAPEVIPITAHPAKTNIRTEHALSVTQKLLEKDLGKGDRQEVERIKDMLTVLRIKSELSPEESERLNESFNALLKLMAKYSV